MNTIGIINVSPLNGLGLEEILKERLYLSCQVYESMDAYSINERSELLQYQWIIVGTEGGEAIAFLKKIKSVFPNLKVIVLGEREDYKEALPYLKLGVEGYISKSMGLAQVIEILEHCILKGQRYVSHHLADSLIYEYFLLEDIGDEKQLSSRQLQIAEMLVKEISAKDIANELGIQISTVNTQKGAIFKKLGVTSIVELKNKIG